MDALEQLELGRKAYQRRAWGDAYQALLRADEAAPLEPPDLELLAMSAYLNGRDDDFVKALDRAHRAYLGAGEEVRAARCAFWLGFRLILSGETGRATGWLARAKRLLERDTSDCAEKGYLLLPVAEQLLDDGDFKAAYGTATEAARIGERLGESDLSASAIHQQGRALLQQGQVDEGLELLDEAMISVTAGELSPLITGLIYCSVIDSCRQVYALGRAREWTVALSQWCEEQSELVAFTGTCLVHRAEIMQLRGAWDDSIEEAKRACERFSRGEEPRPPAAGFYQQAEVHRLRGEFEAAEAAYRSASKWGLEPQPGLAQLRMAQGNIDAAVAAIRRAVSGTNDRLQRTRLLPAYVEIMLAVGNIEDARAMCQELEETTKIFDSDVLRAMSAHARGAVELAAGDAQAALGSLRSAWQLWQQVEAPYAAARVRELLGKACRLLGDKDGCDLEWNMARAEFERLGAVPDIARVDAYIKTDSPDDVHGLTPRELQVLRLIAAGKTNRMIAAQLFISEKTVARHVSNIFTKLGLSSRAAATAYAYQHELT